MRIEKYQHTRKSEWNDFVQKAKNGYFLFLRDFIEYHADRFEDYSLMFYSPKDQLIALLPANLKDRTLHSHQGLTFGGFIVNEEMSTKNMLMIFDQLKTYLLSQGIQRLAYKCIPYIYHTKPTEEDLYALFRHNASLTRRDVSATICLKEKINYSRGHKWGVNKAKKEGLTIHKTNDYSIFWPLLEAVLKSSHQVSPVHNLKEITHLAALFPEHIKLYTVSMKQETIAGCVIFEDKQIAHTQYLANSVAGKKYRALDFLMNHLIKVVYADKQYFDFGISTEDNGQFLNEGLILQKEEFGASAIVHDFYELKID